MPRKSRLELIDVDVKWAFGLDGRQLPTANNAQRPRTDRRRINLAGLGPPRD